VTRSGDSEPYGKCTTELKTSVPEQVHDDFIAIAGANGLSKSELLRNLITSYTNGELAILRHHARRVRAINRPDR